MKITSIRAWPLNVKLATTYWISNNTLGSAGLIVVQVQTDTGPTGLATLHGAQAKQVCAMLAALDGLLAGMDPLAH